ncbi:MAG: hypothetical protein OQK12_09515 [Motiliproteus sp.]|nr:hypothetical protein [Motiliproteus sp.]MCW9051592.1 hypothetical protein [Motiliproteus sp.]
MEKWIAFTVLLGCIVYSEPGSGQFFSAFVLPVVGILSTVYLLGIAASLIVLLGLLSFYFSDLGSDSILESVIAPLSFVFSLFLFLYWAWKTGHLDSSPRVHVGGEGSSNIDSGGGGCDGGGGDGGG